MFALKAGKGRTLRAFLPSLQSVLSVHLNRQNKGAAMKIPPPPVHLWILIGAALTVALLNILALWWLSAPEMMLP